MAAKNVGNAYNARAEVIKGLAATIALGLFFTSIQLFFIGILGEYVLSIHTQTLKRPLVVEQERINF